MAKILIKTLTNCVGRETEDGPEITLVAGRVQYAEESLARSFIALDGAFEASEADLQAQEQNDKDRAEFEARKNAALEQK